MTPYSLPRARRHCLAATALAAPIAPMSLSMSVPVRRHHRCSTRGTTAQNILQTAARSLEEVNNQITSLQNEAQMLINQARNLASLPAFVARSRSSSRCSAPSSS